MKFNAILLPASFVAVSLFTTATSALPVALPRSEGVDLEARDPFWGKIAGAVVKALAPAAINWVANKFKRDLDDEIFEEALAGALSRRDTASDEVANFEKEFEAALLGRSETDLEARDPVWGALIGGLASALAPAAINWIKKKFKRDLAEDEALQEAVASALMNARSDVEVYARDFNELDARDPAWGAILGGIASALAPVAIDWIKKKFKRDLDDEALQEAVVGALLNSRAFNL